MRSETHSITFSEAVTGLDETDFATSTGATVTAVTDSGDQTTYTITFTPTAATFTLILAADSIADEAATPNTGPATAASASGSATSTTDNTAPSVNLGNEIADGVIGTAQDHDFTFDEPVTGLEASDFSGTGIFGRITLSGSGSAYTITIIPTAESFTLTLDANSVVDLSANAGPAAEPVAARSVSGSATRADFNTDTTAPHAHFDVITGAMINARGTVKLNFTKGISGLARGDFRTSTGARVTEVSGSNTTYFITYTPTATEFTLTLAANRVQDTTRNRNQGPPVDVSVRGTAAPAAPTVEEFVLVPATGQVIGAAETARITFSEVVTGLRIIDTAASGAVVVTIQFTTGATRGKQYDITFIPTAVAFSLTLAADSVANAGGSTGPASEATVRGSAILRDTTAPILSFAEIRHTDGVAVARDVFLNLDDTVTVVLQSTEPLATDSLAGAARYLLNTAAYSGQLDMVAIPDTAEDSNRYSVTYTITAAPPRTSDDSNILRLRVSDVMDESGNRAADIDFTTANFIIRHIVDTTPVPLALNGAAILRVAVDGAYTDLGTTGAVLDGDEPDTLSTVITDSADRVVAAVDTSVDGRFTYTYTATDVAGNSVTLTRAVIVGSLPSPTLALNHDTGESNSDGITNDGRVNVGVLAAAAWKYSTNGGADFTAGSGSSFTLTQGIYAADAVQVVQTVSGIDSAAARLDAVTVDTTSPTLDPMTVAGVIGVEQSFTITFPEAVTDFVASDLFLLRVNLASLTAAADRTTYTLVITPREANFSLTLAANSVHDIAGNRGPARSVRITGSATAALLATPSITLNSDTGVYSGDRTTNDACGECDCAEQRHLGIFHQWRH